MRVNGISISDLWLPARAIGPAAKFGSRGVSHDLARFGIEIDGVACAPGDVAQVTQQGAPLAVLDFRVQLLAFTDARDEIAKVQHVVMLSGNLADELVVQVIKLARVAGNGQRAFLAIEDDADLRALEAARVAALAFPDDAFVAEIERGHARVGRFLVVVVVKAVAAAGNAARRIHLQSPAGEVKTMDAVVPKFGGAPMPEPMPVVVQDVVLEWPFGGGPLPQGVIKPIRHRGELAVSDGGAMIGVPAASEEQVA